MHDIDEQKEKTEDVAMKRTTDDMVAWRLQQENLSKPFPYAFPQMPPRFRRCRAFTRALFLLEWGCVCVLILSVIPVGAVMLFRGKRRCWKERYSP